MANTPHYCCTRCGREAERKDLTVKRVQFTTMGASADIKRSRVIAWLCPECVSTDSDYDRDRFVPPRMENIANAC